MAKAILMCGNPGAGKSVFAKQLAEKRGYRYLSIDDMYSVYNGKPNCHDNKFDVWMTFFRQIHAAEMAGHDVIIDTNAPTPDDRNEFLNWFSSFEWHLVWVDAHFVLCEKNNQNRDRVISHEHLVNMFKFFKKPQLHEDADARANWKTMTRIVNEKNKFRIDKEWGKR